jgi:hypothetical protein
VWVPWTNGGIPGYRIKTNRPKANEESPARRLDLLYLASLSLIAILLALGQVFIVKKLGRRSSMLNEISRAARQVALDESLSQAGGNGARRRRSRRRRLKKPNTRASP